MKTINLMTAVLGLTAAVSSQAVTIYSNNFEASSSSGFSSSTISTTPSGTKFLGQFDNHTVLFTHSGLSGYNSLTVEFDLYLIESWDGNSVGVGPDFWSFGINAFNQLTTTFANTGNDQSFPNNYFASNPSHTGATAVNSLGYQFYGDSTYHFIYTFANNQNTLTLDFAGANLQGIGDEGWGLDNFVLSGESHGNVPEGGASLLLMGLGLGALGLFRSGKLRP